MNLTRIAALVTTCSATLALATACGDDSAAGDNLEGSRLVYVTYGGDSITAASKAWLDPFAKANGVQITTDAPSDTAKVKAMVDAGNTTWDLIALDTGSGAVGCGTLSRSARPTSTSPTLHASRASR